MEMSRYRLLSLYKKEFYPLNTAFRVIMFYVCLTDWTSTELRSDCFYNNSTEVSASINSNYKQNFILQGCLFFFGPGLLLFNLVKVEYVIPNKNLYPCVPSCIQISFLGSPEEILRWYL